MKYAKAFWELFGLPITGWDGLAYSDFEWMRTAADQHEQGQKAAQQKANQVTGGSGGQRRHV